MSDAASATPKASTSIVASAAARTDGYGAISAPASSDNATGPLSPKAGSSFHGDASAAGPSPPGVRRPSLNLAPDQLPRASRREKAPARWRNSPMYEAPSSKTNDSTAFRGSLAVEQHYVSRENEVRRWAWHKLTLAFPDPEVEK